MQGYFVTLRCVVAGYLRLQHSSGVPSAQYMQGYFVTALCCGY
jgi:hypothetical protein